MTKDDIIRMAREAGFLIDTHAQQYQPNCILSTHGLIDENLQRFANLVAAHKAEPPLTATSIVDMMPNSIPVEYDGPLMEFARAIEAAHGIKETEK